MTIWMVGEQANENGLWFGKEWRESPIQNFIDFMVCRGVFKDGASRTLLDQLGITFDKGLNLLPPGEWSLDEARSIFDEFERRYVLPRDIVILAGSRVARAACQPFVAGGIFIVDLVKYFVIPHPSSHNRMWNNPATRDVVSTRFKEAVNAVDR